MREVNMHKVISITIPAYNEQKLIASCLDSVLNQTADPEVYEIIVIDNNSTDQTAMIAKSKGVRVECETKKGYVHALRRGVEVSQGEIIAFTDADCRVPADWISKILENFKSSADIVAVGGKLAFYDANPILDKVTRLILIFIDALPGNNMAIKREALEQIGGIDPTVNLSVDYWLTRKLGRLGKLKIDKSLIVITSGRRFKGAFSSDLKYLFNVISMLLYSKPLFFDFPDIRE
jgi:glycosyltransferase involved in cell wall biosynthesis